jgi:hypothetical protein
MNKHDKYLTHVPLYKATIKTATSTPRTKSASIQKRNLDDHNLHGRFIAPEEAP